MSTTKQGQDFEDGGQFMKLVGLRAEFEPLTKLIVLVLGKYITCITGVCIGGRFIVAVPGAPPQDRLGGPLRWSVFQRCRHVVYLGA